MTALRVILIILLVFWLIGLIRLKGFVEYSEEGVLAQLRVLWFRITLFPAKPRQDKPGKEPKPKKPKKPQKPKKPKEKPKDDRPLGEKVGGLWSLFRDAVPLVTGAAGKLLRKLRIDELTLRLTWAADDPADAALGFGAGQAALGTVLPLLDRAFNIRKRDIGVAVDFAREEPVIYARALLSFSIGQLVGFGVVYGCKALALFLRHRPKRKKQARKQDTETGNL